MGWTPDTSQITVTWTDNSVASTIAFTVPTGSPTTLGLQEAPLRPFDLGDGSVRFNLMVNDNAPIFLNDAWPFHIVDEGKLS